MILKSSKGGLFINLDDSSEFCESQFIQLANEETAMYIKNGKGYRIAFDYEKLHEFFNRNNFLEVENYEPPVVVFDGY